MIHNTWVKAVCSHLHCRTTQPTSIVQLLLIRQRRGRTSEGVLDRAHDSDSYVLSPSIRLPMCKSISLARFNRRRDVRLRLTATRAPSSGDTRRECTSNTSSTLLSAQRSHEETGVDDDWGTGRESHALQHTNSKHLSDGPVPAQPRILGSRPRGPRNEATGTSTHRMHPRSSTQHDRRGDSHERDLAGQRGLMEEST
jgi:hypothetical protein